MALPPKSEIAKKWERKNAREQKGVSVIKWGERKKLERSNSEVLKGKNTKNPLRKKAQIEGAQKSNFILPSFFLSASICRASNYLFFRHQCSRFVNLIYFLLYLP